MRRLKWIIGACIILIVYLLISINSTATQFPVQCRTSNGVRACFQLEVEDLGDCVVSNGVIACFKTELTPLPENCQVSNGVVACFDVELTPLPENCQVSNGVIACFDIEHTRVPEECQVSNGVTACFDVNPDPRINCNPMQCQLSNGVMACFKIFDCIGGEGPGVFCSNDTDTDCDGVWEGPGGTVVDYCPDKCIQTDCPGCNITTNPCLPYCIMNQSNGCPLECTVEAVYSDADSGIDLSSAMMVIDDGGGPVDVTPDSHTIVTANYIKYNMSIDPTPTFPGLTQGTYTVEVNVSDNKGNSASKQWSFTLT